MSQPGVMPGILFNLLEGSQMPESKNRAKSYIQNTLHFISAAIANKTEINSYNAGGLCSTARYQPGKFFGKRHGNNRLANPPKKSSLNRKKFHRNRRY